MVVAAGNRAERLEEPGGPLTVGLRLGDEIARDVRAADEDLFRPQQVIAAHELDEEIARVHLILALPVPLHVDGVVAEADGLRIGVAGDRLGDDPAGIREVDQPRRRTQLPHIPADLEHHRDRPQRLREAAGPRGLLADHPVLEGNALVLDSRSDASDPHLRDDEVGLRQRLPAVERQPHLERAAGLRGHALCQRPDDLQLLLALRDIDQPHLPQAELLRAIDQPLHDLRSVAAAASDDGHLASVLTRHLLLPPCPARRRPETSLHRSLPH